MRRLVSRHLEHFLALHRFGNMRRAAEAVSISQPALTKSLRLLEEDAGTPLFNRTPHGLTPTEAGAMLTGYAEAIEQQARLAGLSLGRLQDCLGGSIRIGLGPALAASSFPSVVVALQARFPGAKIVAQSNVSAQLADGVASSAYDLAVGAFEAEIVHPELAYERLGASRMAVIARKGHALLKAKSPAALGGHERIGFLEDAEFERRARAALGEVYAQTRCVFETNSLSIMFEALRAGECYSIVSDLLLSRARGEGLFEAVGLAPLWRFDLGLICKRSLAETRPIREMRALLRCYFEKPPARAV